MNKDGKYDYAMPGLSKDTEYNILNPYDPNAALNSLNNLNIEDFLFYPKEFKKANEFDYFKTSDFKTIAVNKLFIVSRKYFEEIDNDENIYYKTIDLNNFLDENKKIELTHDPKLKEITFKITCEIKLFMQELENNFFKHGEFNSTQKLGRKILDNWEDLKNKSKEAVFELKINVKSLQKVYYKNGKGKLELMMNLIHPPEYRSNFLKLPSNNEHSRDFETTLFPFRNFLHPFSNLKFRNFSIFFEMDEFNDMAGVNERNFEILENILNEKEKKPLKLNQFKLIENPPNDVNLCLI